MEKVFFIAVLTISCLATAATPSASAVEQIIEKHSLTPAGGTVRGGKADNYMSLLDIRRQVNPKSRRERLVIDWGDRILGPSPHGGYYTLEYKRGSRKLILSMALTMSSRIEQNELNTRLQNGLFVRSGKLEFDPVSQAQVLTILLRQPVQVEVASQEGASPARLLIDLGP